MDYQKLKGISIKGLTKDLINKFSILNEAKYFSSGTIQNYLVFIPAKNTLNILVALLGLIRGYLMEYQKKILKILLNQTAILHLFLATFAISPFL